MHTLYLFTLHTKLQQYLIDKHETITKIKDTLITYRNRTHTQIQLSMLRCFKNKVLSQDSVQWYGGMECRPANPHRFAVSLMILTAM